MRILYATFWEIPHVGGVWKYMCQLKDRLKKHGHHVDIVGIGKGSTFLHNPHKKKKVKFKSFNQDLSVFINDVDHFYENKKIQYIDALKQFNLNQYDIIHTHDVVSSGAISTMKNLKPVLITTLHGYVAKELKDYFYTDDSSELANRGRQYLDDLEHLGAISGKKTIVANHWMKKNLMENHQVPEQQILVQHYGYDLVDFQKKAIRLTSLTKPDGKQLLITTSRLIDQKGIHYLIQALSELKNRRSDWVCWIIGDGPDEAKYAAMIRENGLDNWIQMLGARDDIPSIIQIADILIHPTLLDNQPLSIIEAQISGKAVIASNVSGIPEMINHCQTGFLVEPANVVELVDTMDALLQNPSYYNSVGANAQAWGLNHWSMDRSVERLLETYKDVLTKS